MLLYSWQQAPIPGPGEAYYLTKAKHFWNPAWLAGDFFLETANSHAVFYVLCGWLTWFCSLELTAIILRVVSFGLLAAGWVSLIRALIPVAWSSVFTLCFFLTLHGTTGLAGEWMIGGVESKVFAYAFVFIGWAAVYRQSWSWAALCLGIATSFHVLVGGWATILMLIVVLINLRHLNSLQPSGHIIRTLAIPSCIFLICASFGVISTLLALSSQNITYPATAGLSQHQIDFQANYLQVYHRLKFHLDPCEISFSKWALYLLLVIITLRLTWEQLRRKTSGITIDKLQGEALNSSKNVATVSALTSQHFIFGLIAGCCILVLCGIALGFRNGPPAQMPGLSWRVGLLKYYWFRLPDIVIPLCCAITCVRVLIIPNRSQGKLMLCSLLLLVSAFQIHRHPGHDMSPPQYAAWKETCDWIKQQTPADCVVITPKIAWAFSWYADRKEYVIFKNCPQDAAALVEWNRRLTLLDQLRTAAVKDGQCDQLELSTLQAETAAHFVIDNSNVIYAQTPVYRNDYFQVLALPVPTP